MSDIKSVDSNIYGGKAASLALMIGEGINVPPGFVVDAESYMNMDDTLEKIVMEAFDELGSEYVAVRSSAIAEDGMGAAWAGQLETYLNTTKDDLIKNIEACWASLNSDRAKAYAEENSVDLTDQKVAVVVQVMKQSEVSGVAFSAHPVTQSLDHVVIEAAFGLGEAVVSGQVTPDTYIVNKATKDVEKHVAKQTRKLEKVEGVTDWQDVADGEKQKLSDGLIDQLTEQVIKLEKFYGFPVDVEWLVVESEVFITQSRPITTLDTQKTARPPLYEPGVPIFRWGPIPGHYFYISDFIEAITSMHKRYDIDPFPPSNILFVDGEINWLLVESEFFAYGETLFKTLLESKELNNQLQKDWIKSRTSLENIMDNTTDLPELNERVLDFWLPTLIGEFANYGSVGYLDKRLAEFIPDDRERRKAMQIMTAPLEPSFFQKSDAELLSAVSLEEYAKDYHWLGNSYGGVKLLDARYFEKVKAKLPIDLESVMSARFDELKTKRADLIRSYKIDQALISACDLLLDLSLQQDERKAIMMQLQSVKQEFLQNQAKLEDADWKDLLNRSLREIDQANDRGGKYSVKVENGNIDIVSDEERTMHFWRHYSQEKVEGEFSGLSGAIASRGSAARTRGVVKLVRNPGEVESFEEGSILVTEMTSPEYMSLMRKATGIVTDAGGLTSHAAIIARELNVPCIVGTKTATSFLEDGMEVETDTHAGTVRLVEKGKTNGKK